MKILPFHIQTIAFYRNIVAETYGWMSFLFPHYYYGASYKIGNILQAAPTNHLQSLPTLRALKFSDKNRN